jgi:hypothetical protein
MWFVWRETDPDSPIRLPRKGTLVSRLIDSGLPVMVERLDGIPEGKKMAGHPRPDILSDRISGNMVNKLNMDNSIIPPLSNSFAC